MAQQILSSNTFTTAKYIVSATASDGTHTTIAAALTSSSSGDTIFIRPGTYVENLSLKAGVNLAAFSCDSTTPNVTIVGNSTFTGAGTVSITGIRLQTNSAALLTVSGNSASIVYLDLCYLNCTNNTGITFSSSSASALITLNNCYGNTGTTGIALFAMSSAGGLNIYHSYVTNSGPTVTACTQSAGTLAIEHSNLNLGITTSGATAGFTISYSRIENLNTTAITHGCTNATASTLQEVSLTGGTSSAVSVSASCKLNLYGCIINSSNTNAVTGAGTIVTIGSIFTGTSSKSNATTQTGGAMNGLTQGTAPSAGQIGEQIRGYATGVSQTDLIAKDVTSISVTPGVWDISACLMVDYTGNPYLCNMSISSTSATLTSNKGDDFIQFRSSELGAKAISIPSFRVTLSATTTYYLVATSSFTTGTSTSSGRISATRVG